MLRDKLMQIKQGMTVKDRNQDNVGDVAMVFFSDEDPDTPYPQTVTAQANHKIQTPRWVNDFVSALGISKSVPEPLKKRLHREGFIRVHEDNFLGDKDYFITVNQIANVVGNTVTLNIRKENLLAFN